MAKKGPATRKCLHERARTHDSGTMPQTRKVNVFFAMLWGFESLQQLSQPVRKTSIEERPTKTGREKIDLWGVLKMKF